MTSLYRKYRPNNFSSVFGQDHITKTLSNQIKEGAVSHAYLFTGVRGTGKTSVAKIFARAINCGSEDLKPCNECETCLDVLANRSANVIEIDAASNNGVDNIRDIREEVKYPPVTGKYKVYIIDEVHMLSTGAFNAMLKTLEEPPSHVVFILATTDPNKVPPTIHSRVQRFDFRRISTEILVGNIREYTIKEGINITDEALTYIAKLGDGSARDTLSILDKAASVNKELDIKALQEILGNIDSSIVHALAQSILEKDASEIISIIEHINSLGKDYMGLVQELISHFRDLLVKEISKNSEIVAILIYCLEELITLSQTIKNEKYPRLFVEIYCIKMALHENTFNPETIQTSELVQRTTKQEAACEKSQITDWRTALNKEEKYKKEETKKEVQIGLTEEQIHELTNKINTQIEWR